MNNLSYKSKVHFFFGCGLLLVFGYLAVINLLNGQTFWSAIVGALGNIRPLEYGMYFAFWYWLSRGQQTNSRSELTTLNLRGDIT
ncbi:MAG TPA: hypothetical protein VJV03_05995 [Pyrinomonadaceae bacterium]|nr:hypothetical protein [Pyrinomonadaceae bacterium]